MDKHQTARLANQCVHPDTGQTGDWLFVGDSHRQPGSAVSPVFRSLIDLFDWCRRNGWTQRSGTYLEFDKHN